MTPTDPSDTRPPFAGDSTPSELLAALGDDRDRRWRAGDRVPTEQYLAAHPFLAAAPECALELVYGEYLIREHLGERPAVEEFTGRFPALAERLRRQVELHRALAAPAD